MTNPNPDQQAFIPEPLISFTNNQWYCHQARQTVFFAAFSNETPDLERLVTLAGDLLHFAPQLASGYLGADPTRPISQQALQELVSIETTSDLSAYPDQWQTSGEQLFDTPDKPMFRIRAVVLSDSSSNAKPKSAIFVLSTHSLFEGADSALLSRSQSAGRDMVVLPPARQSLIRRVYLALVSSVLAPLQLLIAAIIAPRSTDHGYKTMTLSRESVRRVAAHLGVRQRSLLFALVAFGLNDQGRTFSRRKIFVIYTDLEGTHVASTNDDFFRFRVIEAKFKVREDFAAFVKGVDREIQRKEKRDNTLNQAMLNALFAVHRRLKSWMPFLYPDRIFRFAGFYHLDLSMVTPHRLQGPLTKGMVEPVYCGTHHPGLQSSIFVPGKKYVTLNFTMDKRLLQKVGDVEKLFNDLENSL